MTLEDVVDLLALRGVEVGYHGRRLLPPIHLTISRGTFLGIVGPNGCGKTTLVRVLLGLLSPLRGSIELPGGRPPRFGYVPQRSEHERTFPVTALDLVIMGRFPRIGLLRRVGAADRRLAGEALESVGLGGMGGRPLATLSGGQQQRALIARALVSEPEVLVLDEPTVGMDLVSQDALLALVESLRQARQLGVVMVTHQLEVVASYAREVLVLDRERQIVDGGPVAEVITPERLSHLYGADVRVSSCGGQRSVFVHRPTGEAAP